MENKFVRYCSTNLNFLVPCQVGWIDYPQEPSDNIRTCKDEPCMENCRNLVSSKFADLPIVVKMIGNNSLS